MPLYQQIEEQIGRLIEEGTLPPGVVLPAERQLAESLGLSRVTIRRAYDALRQRTMLLAQGRRGFVVREIAPRLEPGMDRLKGFTEEMRLLGKRASSRILEREVVTDRMIASIFGLPSTARFLRLVRVRSGDDVPLSRETAWYSLRAAPDLEEADLTNSVYEVLANRCNLPLVTCEQTIEAAMADEAECEIFGFDEPLPCLLIKRRSFGRGEIMVEYVEGLFRGDAYNYRLTLRA